MNKEQQLLNHPAVISYSFRKTTVPRSGFIVNYPVHAWLLELLPKVLANIIIFDYWLASPEEQARIQVDPVFPLTRINDKFLNTFPLRDEKGGCLFPSAPEGSEQTSLATLALEARMYKESSSLHDLPLAPECYYPIGTYERLKKALPPVLRSLKIPKVLDEIILSYLNFEHWKRLLHKHADDYKKSFDIYFPWKNDEKHLRLTKKLIDAEKYTSREQTTAIYQLIEVHLPTALANLVKEYTDFDELKTHPKKTYLDEISGFIHKYEVMEASRSHTLVNGEILSALQEVIAAIKENAWFDEKRNFNHLKKVHFLATTCKAKNAFEYWIFFFTQKSFFTHAHSGPDCRIPNITFFEHIIRHYGCLEEQDLKNLKWMFYMAKALVESMLIITAKIPQHHVFYFSQDMALSLYLHINNHLKLPNELMRKDVNGNIVRDKKGHPIGLNNQGQRPVLLEKALSICGEKILSVEFNRSAGFFIVPAEQKSGTRLLNYHKRAAILDILYNYLHAPTTTLFSTVFGGGKKAHEYEAKELITKILEAPASSPEIYILIAQIKQTLGSGTIKDADYQHVLKQVELQLTLEQQQNSISFS